MVRASIEDFSDQRNPLPGDRKGITAVGKYILELYYDPLGQRPKAIIEVNTVDEQDKYHKLKSIVFSPDDYDDPEAEAQKTYEQMSAFESAVERRL
jgi:hypothetical protein